MLQRLSVFLFFSRQLFCFVLFFFVVVVVVVVVCSGGDVEPGPPGAVPQPKCFLLFFKPRESFWAVYLFLYARTGTREEKKRATPS